MVAGTGLAGFAVATGWPMGLRRDHRQDGRGRVEGGGSRVTAAGRGSLLK
jgi:hypothetical protein